MNTPKPNYQRQLDSIIANLQRDGIVPHLLLHSCCAPCSSYVLEYLSQYFKITLFYYNPNIIPESEYHLRAEEQQRLIAQLPAVHPITFVEGHYDPQEFLSIAKGLETAPEGGERCFRCYELRLRQSALKAKELGADYFTTTLTISPLKNAEKINELGSKIAEEIGVKFLPSDFKKRGGYLRSIQLSKEYDLYRQNFCGCPFSRQACLNNGEK